MNLNTYMDMFFNGDFISGDRVLLTLKDKSEVQARFVEGCDSLFIDIHTNTFIKDENIVTINRIE